MTDSIGRTTARRMFGTFSASSVNAATGLLTGVLIARWLSVDERGQVATILFWPMLFAGFGLLSISAATVYQIARTPPQDRASLRATAVALAFGLAIATALAAIVAMPLLVREPGVAQLAQLYAALVMIPHFVGLTLISADQGEMRFGRYNTARLLPQPVFAICLIGLIALSALSVPHIVLAQCVGTLAVLLFYAAKAWRECWASVRLDDAAALLKTGLGQHASAVVSMLRSQADRMITVALLSNAQIGFYVIAATAAQTPVNMVVSSVTSLLVPRLSQEESLAERNRILTKAFRSAAALLSVFAPILALAVPILLPSVFGAQYAAAVPTAQIYIAAAFLLGLQTVLFEGLRGYNALKLRFAAEVMFLLFGLVLALIMRMSTPEGMATWLALTVAVNLAATIGIFHRAFGVALRDFSFLTVETYALLFSGVRQSMGKRGWLWGRPH